MKDLLQASALAGTPNQSGFKSETEILQLVPVSRRTWGNWKAKGIVPYVKLGRRCLYDWESVRKALLRLQRGGDQ
jgi:hypothetical protein